MSDDLTRRALLEMSLAVAVPCWIAQLQQQPWAYIEDRREPLVQMIASHGDNILFKSKKPGATAVAFNALAESVAILAFCPGGVRIFGRHWQADHPEGVKQS